MQHIILYLSPYYLYSYYHYLKVNVMQQLITRKLDVTVAI